MATVLGQGAPDLPFCKDCLLRFALKMLAMYRYKEYNACSEKLTPVSDTFISLQLYLLQPLQLLFVCVCVIYSLTVFFTQWFGHILYSFVPSLGIFYITLNPWLLHESLVLENVDMLANNYTSWNCYLKNRSDKNKASTL